MNNIEAILHELHLETRLSDKDIPDIDLYMDQVIQLFENKFAETKRIPEEKILTKTMINNYSKGKLFFSIKDKKYSKEHIMLINMIYEMKTVLSISDIKHTLTKLNKEITTNDFELELFYKTTQELSVNNVESFTQDSMQLNKEVKEKAEKLKEEDSDYFEKLLLILSLVNRSNYYRRAAEKIVDQLASTETKKD